MRYAYTRCGFRSGVCATAAILSLLSLERSACASTSTAPIAVSATVLQTCVVTASPLAFGNYDPTVSTPTDGSTSVIVTCTNGTPYNVGLNAGSGSNATVSTRTLASGSGSLNYSLYQDTARSTLWGNTVGTNTVGATATGLPISYNVYGRIPAQQTAGTGAYTDTVTVSVYY